MRNLGGRPSKYNPDFVQELESYLSEEMKLEFHFPTVEKFALRIGVDPDTINNWAKVKVKDEKGENTNKLHYPQFAHGMHMLKMVQKHRLMEDGLFGGKKVNARMAIFLLKVNHGMRETQQTYSKRKLCF